MRSQSRTPASIDLGTDRRFTRAVLLIVAVTVGAIHTGSIALATDSAGRAAGGPEGDWPNWRGPSYNGSAAELADGAGLAIAFGREENVRWKATLPGPGASTPIIVGDHVFLTSTDLEREALVAMCLDRATGELRWNHTVDLGYVPGGSNGRLRLDSRSYYAAPSPVTDGERVIFFFGIGDLIAFELDGEELWSRNLQQDYGDFAFQWTFSASPTLLDGRLFLPILQRNEPANGRGAEGAESFLLAMDPTTGETLYRHVRPSDARRESLESYATAIPHTDADGKTELLVVGGDVITAHDPTTGDELWRWGTWNPDHREEWWRVVPSAVVGGGVALLCAPKRAPVFAVKLGRSGDISEDGLVWKSEGRPNPLSSDVPTPLFYRGAFYVLSDVQQALSKVDPSSGEVAWTIEMPGRPLWRASPTGAFGRVWCMNHAGTVCAIDAATGEIVAQIEMGEEDADHIRSSIAVARGDLFIRTNATLYCVGTTVVAEERGS